MCRAGSVSAWIASISPARSFAISDVGGGLPVGVGDCVTCAALGGIPSLGFVSGALRSGDSRRLSRASLSTSVLTCLMSVAVDMSDTTARTPTH